MHLYAQSIGKEGEAVEHHKIDIEIRTQERVYHAVGFILPCDTDSEQKCVRSIDEAEMFARVHHGHAVRFQEEEIACIIASGQLPTDKWVMYRDVRGETYSLAPIRPGVWLAIKACDRDRYGEFNLVLTRGS